MRGPDGTENDDTGCYLEAVAGYRLVFTSALGPGFRPQAADEFSFTTALEFEDTSGGTRYTERALHAGREDARKHSEMGFEVGWNAALDQLVALSDEIE